MGRPVYNLSAEGIPVKATRFMRQPFFVSGFKVTEGNMAALAKWCEGHIISTTNRPFIRVPVAHATNIKLTEAYVDTWILLSRRGGRKSFKVYSEEYLTNNFFILADDNVDNFAVDELDIPSLVDA
jgi:hypothetical protein